jgi:hypothetical protein
VVGGLIVPEVLSGLRDSLAVETDGDAAKLLIAVGDVEVDLRNQLATTNLKYGTSGYKYVHTLWVILGPLVASTF